MNVGFVLQARSDSKRLPNKAFLPLGDSSLIEKCFRILIDSAVELGMPILATTDRGIDNDLAELAQSYGLYVYRGPLENVLERFYKVSQIFELQIISRLTGDNPFIPPTLQRNLILDPDLKYNYPIILSTRCTGMPKGLDFEAFNATALKLAHSFANSDYDLEHVTPLMYRESLFRKKIKKIEFSNCKFENYSIDTHSDYEACRDNISEYEVAFIKSSDWEGEWKYQS